NGIATTTSSPTGSFTAIFTVPTSTGVNTVTATDSTNSPTAPFTVITQAGITLSPTSGPVGTSITVTGTGFLPSHTITINYPGNNGIATTTSSPTGSFTAIFTVPTSTGVNTVTATDSTNSPTAPFTVITPTINQIMGYVIFGTQQVHLEQNTIITGGNVGLQNKGQIHIEQNSALPSSDVVGDQIHLEQNVVTGPVFYNSIQLGQGVLVGTKTTPLLLPVLASLPPFPLLCTVGSSNINVNSGSQTITPGNYNNISAGNSVTLEFSGGIYNINSLSTGNSVTLKFDGPSYVFVKSSINTGQGTTLNPTLRADQVLFYAGSQIHIQQMSNVNANMYAPNDQIHFERNTQATGAFIAQSIHIEQGSTINFDYGFPSNLPTQGNGNGQIISTHGQGSVGSSTSFTFNVQPGSGNNLQGSVQYSDQSQNKNLQSVLIQTLSLNSDGSVTFTGKATVNGVSGYTFSVTTADRADTTSNPDLFQIAIFDNNGNQIYSNPGQVTQGDVEVQTSNQCGNPSPHTNPHTPPQPHHK
ncbi:MAG: hypothetical protein KGI25_09245, partial [Thaumarchaeota archaeon]|nr:hypothetical protein [Nitrososphaerota archaeon]